MWRDETAEVDVLGLLGDKIRLLGECRWPSRTADRRDFTELYRKIVYVPNSDDDPALMFWTRSGQAEPGFPAQVYSAEDITTTGVR